MSSRLFQEVRERQGLCYNIYTYGAGYQEIGTFHIYAALGKETEQQALAAIRQAVERFAEEGVSQAELDRVRELAKANVLMGLESTTARMNHMARSALRQEPVRNEEEIIAAYDSVTAEQIRELARRPSNGTSAPSLPSARWTPRKPIAAFWGGRQGALPRSVSKRAGGTFAA